MKKILIVTALLLVGGITFGQTLKNGAIVEFHHFTLNLDPDVTFNQWLDFAQNTYLPVWEKNFKGIKSVVMKGDRGVEKNDICWINFYNSKELRSEYFKDEGIFVPNEKGMELQEKVMPTWNELSKLGPSELDFSTDWVVLPINNTSEQKIEKGNMLGAHVLKPQLNPDVTMNQFLEFMVTRYNPVVEKNLGWKSYFLRADRGKFQGKYMMLYWIESVEARDKFYDSEGRRTEEGDKAFEKIRPLYEEMQKMVNLSSEYTDWVVL